MSIYSGQIWAIEPLAGSGIAQAINEAVARDPAPERIEPIAAARVATAGGASYLRTDSGVAVFRLAGVVTKDPDPWMEALGLGGASNVMLKRAIQAAAVDDQVSRAVMFVDSPGGAVPGTQELSEAVADFAAAKPLHAHIDDLGASAAYWAIAPATRITINAMGEAGSIGAMAAVIDSSRMAEDAGVKVHLVSSGELKGQGYPGTEISEGALADLQARIDRMASVFFTQVRTHRGLTDEQMETATTGRVFGADEAMALGLVDGIAKAEDVIAQAVTESQAERDGAAATRRRRARSVAARLNAI